MGLTVVLYANAASRPEVHAWQRNVASLSLATLSSQLDLHEMLVELASRRLCQCVSADKHMQVHSWKP